MDPSKINDIVKAFKTMDLTTIPTYSSEMYTLFNNLTTNNTNYDTNPDKITPAMLNDIAVNKIYGEIKKKMLENALLGEFEFDLLNIKSKKVILAIQSKLVNEGFSVEQLLEDGNITSFKINWI